jgi:serine/threonine-protein kinase
VSEGVNFNLRADRICVGDLEGEIAALKSSGGNLLTILRRIQASDATVAARLAALNPPPQRRRAFDRFLADVRALAGVSGGVTNGQNYTVAQAPGSMAAADARAAGLKACAEVYAGLSSGTAVRPAPRSLRRAAVVPQPAAHRRLEVIKSPVAINPQSIAVGAGGLWVLNVDGSVTQIDPRSGRLSQPISVGGENEVFAVGPSVVWAANSNGNTVTRISARTGQTIGVPIPVGNSPSAIAVGPIAVWVANQTDGTVSRIGPGGPINPPIKVGNAPDAIAVGARSVWVANTQDNTVTRIDPSTGQVRGAPIPVGQGPAAIAVGQGGVWVANSIADTVTRIDPTTGRAIARPIPVGSNPSAIAIAAGSVWVANQAQNTVTRIDARTGRVLGRPIDVGSNPSGLAAGYGGVWVASANTITLIRP